MRCYLIAFLSIQIYLCSTGCSKSSNEKPTMSLVEAVKTRNTAQVELGLHHGADPNSKTENGEPVMALAIHKGDVAIANLLLEKGASVEFVYPEDGETLLHSAATFCHVDIAKALIKHGAKVNALGKYYAPLHLAASGNCAPVVKLLLENGADVDIKSSSNQTPLARAVVMADIDVVEILLKHGANVEIQSTRTYETPLSLAKNKPKVLELLRKYSKK